MKKIVLVNLVAMASAMCSMSVAHAPIAGGSTTTGVILNEVTQLATGWKQASAKRWKEFEGDVKVAMANLRKSLQAAKA